MHHRYRLGACASIAALATALCSVPAFAQDNNDGTPTEAIASDQSQTADEVAEKEDVIVVTAQKRAENVQDVPISIAAFSGETLEKNNVVNIEGLAKVTPNFNAAKGAQSSYIRLSSPRHWRGQQHDRRAQCRRVP